MQKRWLSYVLPALFLCSGFELGAQRPVQTPIVFLDTEQGLSNNTVRCIYKDHNGFMWFGTRDGLNRYDGNSFTVYRHVFKDTNSLGCDFVLSLCEDKSNRLWIGTRQGLNIYDNLQGHFSTISFTSARDRVTRPIAGVIRLLQRDDRGYMLIGTEGSGLLLYAGKGATAVQIPFMDGGTPCWSYTVQAVRITEDNRTWVQVQGKGICLLNTGEGQLHLVNSQLPGATCMENIGTTLWVCNGSALYQYDPLSNSCTRKWQLPSNDHIAESIWAMRADHNGHLLMGTMLGRYLCWDVRSGRLDQNPGRDSVYSLYNNTIYGIYVDEFSNQWLATAKEGVGVIDPQRSRFHTFSAIPGVEKRPLRFVTSFFEASDSNFYIGTEGQGILRYDRHKDSFAHLKGFAAGAANPPGEMVMSLCGDYLGNIWAAAQFSGVDRLDPKTRRFEKYFCTKGIAGTEKNWVWTVYEDKRKNLWAATLRQGSMMGALYRFDRGANRFAVFDSTLSDLFTLYEDKQGVLWGGNLTQLVRIDRSGQGHHHFYSAGSAVRTIWEDRRGQIWIGTEGGGLMAFDRDRGQMIARYSTDEGLCNNTVLGILEEEAGDLWLSTGNGLSRFNAVTHQFRNYYKADGLQSNQFIYASALRLRSGEFAFGGVRGFNLFDPATIRQTGQMPRVILTGITVNGVPLQKDPGFVHKWGRDQVEELKVPFSKAYFSFDFTALEYSTPKEISYTYFMEGWDHKWTDAGHQHKATYTHLDEGHYIFHVRSTDREGRWNNAGITMGITVLPPWYRSWWAYSLYLLVAFSMAYIYWLYKARQTKLQYEVTIQRLNAEKEREAYERKQAFFTNVSHEFRTPLTLIINPVKDLLDRSTGVDHAELHVIHRNARRMLSLIDQLLLFRKADSGVDSLKPVQLNFYHLCREVYLSFTQQAKTRKIRYEFECPTETIELFADREKIEIILFNLVSNALKYAPEGGCVSLVVSEGLDLVEVRVTDNGPGVPAGTGDRIFQRFYQAHEAGSRAKPGFGIGLFLARQFAMEHKGSLSYSSVPGKGAEFVLRVPKVPAAAEDGSLVPDNNGTSGLFKELIEEDNFRQSLLTDPPAGFPGDHLAGWVDEKRSVLVVDDDAEMRGYIVSMFRERLTVYEAADGNAGVRLAHEHLPDIIISDIKMEGLNGIDLCRTLKSTPETSHIPVILLTGALSDDLQLEGLEGGAADYITKPFDKDLLLAKVKNLFQSRNKLRESLFNEVTHNNESLRRISADDKAFLEKCTAIVEAHLDEEAFTIRSLALEVGLSHSSLYKKVKALSGHSLNAFIRLIRLRNAAMLCINSTYNVNEIALQVGIFDRTHFREQFQKVYGMTAAAYIKKYRKPFTAEFALKKRK